MKNISIVVAMSGNRVIGYQSKLPWCLPADMRRFREITEGHAVIMGRKTYESLPEKWQPLPNRVNIVVSQNPFFEAKGCIVAASLEKALLKARYESEVFVIGGQSIYELALPYAQKIFVTLVDGRFKGDAFFPEIDLNEWQMVKNEGHVPDNKNEHSYSFLLFERKGEER